MLHKIQEKAFQQGRTKICKTPTIFAKELDKLGGQVVISLARHERGTVLVFEAVGTEGIVDPHQNAVGFEVAPCPPFCTRPLNLYFEAP